MRAPLTLATERFKETIDAAQTSIVKHNESRVERLNYLERLTHWSQ